VAQKLCVKILPAKDARTPVGKDGGKLAILILTTLEGYDKQPSANA
jgi:hypothetical protein